MFFKYKWKSLIKILFSLVVVILYFKYLKMCAQYVH